MSVVVVTNLLNLESNSSVDKTVGDEEKLIIGNHHFAKVVTVKSLRPLLFRYFVFINYKYHSVSIVQPAGKYPKVSSEN